MRRRSPISIPVDDAAYEMVTGRWPALERLDRGGRGDGLSSPSIPRPPRSTPCRPSLVGVSLSVDRPALACYIPLGHKGGGGNGDDGRSTLGGPTSRPERPLDDAIAGLKDARCLKTRPCSRSAEPQIRLCRCSARYGIEVAPYRRHHAAVLCARHRARRPRHGRACEASISAMTRSPSRRSPGSGKSQVTFDYVPIDKALGLRRRRCRHHTPAAQGC